MNKATRLLVWGLINMFVGFIMVSVGGKLFWEALKWWEYILPSLICLGGFVLYLEGVSMCKKSVRIK